MFSNYRKRNHRYFPVILFLILFTVAIIYKFQYYLWAGPDSIVAKSGENRSRKLKPACHIPQLNPYHKSILRVLNDGPSSINCEASYPLLFNSTLKSTIIPAKGQDYFRDNGYESCCYRTVERDLRTSSPDDNVKQSSKCFPLSLKNETKIPIDHEFVAIYCKQKNGSNTTFNMVDVHAFVHLKPKPESLSNSSTPRQTYLYDYSWKYNVVIFGIDSVSRMTLLRSMPKSYAYLKRKMGAVEMVGYNKVAANTLPNLVPMLTSLQDSERKCSPDNCSLIWKEYSKAGYYTYYGEDIIEGALFNYGGPGFIKQPTDYYLRPISLAGHTYVGSNSINTKPTCFGPRPTLRFLLDHMEKFMYTMKENKKNFFHFSWASALTHDYVNTARFGDADLLQSLQWLKESRYLRDTIFILMSDHGQRFAEIRNTVQGHLEDCLPFMFFVLPDSLKKYYDRAFMNMLDNKDRLITTFDLHETLKDMLNPENIKEDPLKTREAGLSQAEKAHKLPRGVSLFLPIPAETRTCEMAGIQMNYCSCTILKPANFSSPAIKDAARAGVSHINSILGNHQSQCAHLELNEVNRAQQAQMSNANENREAYLINFETKPGGGQFETLVGKTMMDSWEVVGTVARTNMYGNQSRCVEERILKPYCYCKNFHS